MVKILLVPLFFLPCNQFPPSHLPGGKMGFFQVIRYLLVVAESLDRPLDLPLPSSFFDELSFFPRTSLFPIL